MHEKILRGIISDLMKMPMQGHDSPESVGPMDGAMEPKEAHIEIMASGKPKGDLSSELDPDHDGDIDHIPGMKPMHGDKQNKKLHAMGHMKK